MEHDLNNLEQTVSRLLEAVRELRRQNQDLSGRLGLAEAEKERLQQRMEQARQRLDALLERLPVEQVK